MVERNHTGVNIQWGPEFRGWTVRFVSTWVPSLKAVMDFDDLMQEAYLQFDYIKSFPQVIDPPHYMALYKLAVKQRFTDILYAHKMRPKHIPMSQMGVDSEVDYLEKLLAGVVDEGFGVSDLRVMIQSSAPPDVMKVLLKLIGGEYSVPDKQGGRMTTKEYYWYLSGCRNEDIVDRTRKWVKEHVCRT